jgi:hypothetical protein
MWISTQPAQARGSPSENLDQQKRLLREIAVAGWAIGRVGCCRTNSVLGRGRCDLRRRRPVSAKTLSTRLAIFCLVPILAAVSPDSPANQAQEGNQQPSPLQVVIVLDVNPNQHKVFALESALATGVLDRLNQRDAAVSLVTFGSQEPVLRIANAKPSNAIDTITNVNLEQSREKYFAVHLYRALDLALNQFKDDPRPKSLLIVAEGREDFGGKQFKQIVSRAHQLRVNCYVALVASHSLRGSKSILKYGFYLSDLARKTHARCIEVGDRRKKLPRFVERFSTDILNQGQKSSRCSSWSGLLCSL